MKNIPTFLVFVCLLISCFSFSQIASSDSNQKSSNSKPGLFLDQLNLSFKHLPPIPDNESIQVLEIAQDARGFIWVAVYRVGLYRFDGYDFQFFPEVGDVNDLFIDKEKKLWIGSGKGLFKYDHLTGQFERFQVDIAIRSIMKTQVQEHLTKGHGVISISQDQEGHLWLGTSGGGIARRDKITGEFHQYYYEGVGENQAFWFNIVRKIHVDNNGTVWGDSQMGALLRLSPGAKTVDMFELDQEDQSSWRTNVIYEDDQGLLWVCTFNGMWRLNPVTLERKHFPYNGIRFNYIHQADDGKFWIGSHEGIVLFDPVTETYGPQHQSNPSDAKSLDANWVNHVFQDHRGDYWVSTMGGTGIHFLDLTTPQFTYSQEDFFPKIVPHNPYRLNPIATIFEDSDSVLWIGGEEAVLSDFYNPALLAWDQKNGQVQTFEYTPSDPNSLSDHFVTSIFEDSGGDLWIGTAGLNGGLNRLDRSTGKFDQFLQVPNPQKEREFIENCITNIYEDQEKNLWVSSMAGLHRFDRKTEMLIRYRQHPEDSLLIATKIPEINLLGNRAWNSNGQFFTEDSLHLDGNRPGSIGEDIQGNLWLGTRVGISRLDPNTHHYRHVWPDTSIISEEIFNPGGILSTLDKKFWMVIDNKLVLFDPVKAEPEIYVDVPFLQDRAGINLLSIDEHDRIWFIEISGKNTTIQLHNYHYKTEKFESYGVKNGIPAIEYAGMASASVVSPSGRFFLFFNQQIGFLHCDPNQFRNSQFSPSVAITSFTRFNSQEEFGAPISDSLIHGKDSVLLTYKDNILSFKFAALNFNNPEDNQYAYQVEGFSDNWINIGNSRELTLTNLDPGQYTLRVKGSNNEGLWSKESTALQLTILPPWWETNLAYFAYVLLFAGILYTIFSFLRKRWQLQNQLKLEQAEANRIKELDTFKSTFYTNITHEFRTPLTVILGMNRQVKEQPQKFLEEGTELIERNGKNLLNQINQILDLSKLETNSLQLNTVQSDIVEFLRYSTEAFQSFANGQNLSLRFFSRIEKLLMDYDPESLQNIMSNLISNAMKFTPDGGDVKVSLVKMEEQMVVKVEDTGVGISEKDLPYIFDRFYQVEKKEDQNATGTGIGLAYVQELVKMLGGSISVESELGKGTSFTVSLPIRNEARLIESTFSKKENLNWIPSQTRVEKIGATRTTIEQSPVSNESLPQLLLIEDNADVVIYLKSCLSDQYQIDVAYNGRIGIEKALENIPDLIISDVMMPDKDGFEVCDTLKNDERTSHIPLILLTAKADAASKLAGLKRGADAYLSKPFDKEELLVRLEMLVERQKRMVSYFSKNEEGRLSENVAAEVIEVEDVFIKKINTILEENIGDEDFGLPQLCQKVRMSRSQLFRKMKALTDTAPSAFIKSYRLQKAKHLLENREMNVAEAAYEVGFKDPSYFSKIFQEEFGIIPSATGK